MAFYTITLCGSTENDSSVYTPGAAAQAFLESVIAGGGYFFGTVPGCVAKCTGEMTKYYGCFFVQKFTSLPPGRSLCTLTDENFDWQNRGSSFYSDCASCLQANPDPNIPQGLLRGGRITANISWSVKINPCPGNAEITFINHVPVGYCTGGSWITTGKTSIYIKSRRSNTVLYNNTDAPDTVTVTLDNSGFNFSDYVIALCDKCGQSHADYFYIGNCIDCSTFLATETHTDGNCSIGGSITVSTTNGTGPFQYSWFLNNTPQPSLLNSSVTNLVSGTYKVVVTDSKGCIFTIDNIIITNDPGPVITLSSANETCGQGNGLITASVSGGKTPYIYNWFGPNGFSSNQLNLTNLTAGTYTLSVTDSNDCTTTEIVNIINVNTDGCNICYLFSFCDNSHTPITLKFPSFQGPLGSNPNAYVGRWFSGEITLIGPLTGVETHISGCFYLQFTDCLSNPVIGSQVTVDTLYNSCEDCNPSPCWRLTYCLNPLEFYDVSTDLTSLVGSVINHVTIEGSPAPPIPPWKCFIVSQIDPCHSSLTLESHGTIYPDCNCCNPSNLSPEPPPERVIPLPVKRFYQVTIPDCDIKNIKSLATGYYSLFKTLKYGITSCCTNYDLEALWLSNELTKLSLLNIPEVICKYPPKPHCRPIPKNSCNPCLPTNLLPLP